MRLLNHGGMCCGIFHIFGFPNGNANAAVYAAEFQQAGPEDTGRPRIPATQAFEQLVAAANGGHGHAANQPRLTEIVLTDSQLATWEGIITARGFRKVVRFRNGNTEAFCNIFHRYPGPNNHYQVFEANMPAANVPAAVVRASFTYDNQPFYLIEAGDLEALRRRPEVPPPAPAPEVRDVFTTFHCVYRDGRVGAGYDSADEARAANPRVRSVRRRVIRSDGTVRWED